MTSVMPLNRTKDDYSHVESAGIANMGILAFILSILRKMAYADIRSEKFYDLFVHNISNVGFELLNNRDKGENDI